jgi:hypothetical protein
MERFAEQVIGSGRRFAVQQERAERRWAVGT